MKTNRNLTIERLRETVNQKNNCNAVYLKLVKSELFKVLSKYMSLESIDFLINNSGEKGYNLNINVSVNEFYEI